VSSVVDLIASARAATDHDSDTQVTDTQLTAWLNEFWPLLWRKVGNQAPTLIAKVTAAFAVTGTSQDVTASPLSLTDFDRVYRVERQYGSVYLPLEAADPLNPENTYDVSFLERLTTLEFYPTAMAPGTYRLTYLPKAATLANTSTALPLPAGYETALTERLASRIRVRFEEDPTPHLSAWSLAEAAYLKDLRRRYGTHVVPGLRRIRGVR
jgi:hypothetical protein